MKLTVHYRDATGNTDVPGAICERLELVAETSSDLGVLTLVASILRATPDRATRERLLEIVKATMAVDQKPNEDG